MKNRFLILIILAVVLGQANVWAQEKGKFRIGVSGAMGTQSALNDAGNNNVGFGVTFTGDYFASNAFNAALGYTFFFKSSFSSPALSIDLESSTIDLDGKYYFLNEGVGVYGLLGFSLGFVKTETTIDLGIGPGGTSSLSETKYGMNMGVGADYYLSDRLFLNTQVKYNLALEQIAINLGVGFSLN
jgi:opacity protein-like surface antigen